MPRLHPRRVVTLIAIVGIFILVNLIVGRAAVDTDTYQALRKANPFGRPSAHAPPLAANSTSGDSSWFNDWNWLNPFSSTITLDESTSVLPPLARRTYIYSYYDTSAKRTAAQQQIDNEVILTWRRAWWAQGFHPVVLSREDAESNPLYGRLLIHKLRDEMEHDAMRWLAWARMGTGILCDYHVFPMGSHDNALLHFLRRGDFKTIRKYPKIGEGNAIYSGPESAIANSIKFVLNLDKITKYLISAELEDVLADNSEEGLAEYSESVIKERYEEVQKTPSLLPALINSHLHLNFHNTFAEGIYIGRPASQHTSVLSDKAVKIAKSLAVCPESPIPTSCPPNMLRCKSCDPAHPLKVAQADEYVNGTSKFTIMAVPHPYTFLALTMQKDSLTVPIIRRDTERDGWVTAATRSMFKKPVGGAPRVVKLKEAVASDWATSHSLWLTPESPDQDGLEWHFGFNIAMDPKEGKSISIEPLKSANAQVVDLNRERNTLARAIDMTRSKRTASQKLIAATEAWNLADTEIWRFVKAFNARLVMERKLWQQKESKYAGGGATSGAKKGWSKWLDS